MTLHSSRKNLILVLFILAAAAWRILGYFFEHNGIFGLTPLFAIALFSGAYLAGNFKAVAIPLSVLFISDLVLTFTVYSQYRQGLLYSGWQWVYLSLLLITLIGKIFLKRVNAKNLISAAFLSSLTHWLVATLPECTAETYVHRLTSAAGYELRILAGTLVYGFLLFGVYEWMKSGAMRRGSIKKIG
jgi:hypothetical protein